MFDFKFHSIPAPQVLFVAGGGASLTEVLDLSGQNLTCRPIRSLGTHGGISSLKTQEGNPLACGGSYPFRTCYEYNPITNEWDNGPNLIHERISAPAVEIPNSNAIHWIAGGSSGEGFYTSEFLQDGIFVEGPELPNLGVNSYECAAAAYMGKGIGISREDPPP